MKDEEFKAILGSKPAGLHEILPHITNRQKLSFSFGFVLEVVSGQYFEPINASINVYICLY